MNELVARFQSANQEFREQHQQSIAQVVQVCKKLEKVHHEMELENKIEFLKLADALQQVQQGLEQLKAVRDERDARLHSDTAQQDQLADMQTKIGKQQYQNLEGNVMELVQAQFDEFQKHMEEKKRDAEGQIGREYTQLQASLAEIRQEQQKICEENLADISRIRQSYLQDMEQLREEIKALKTQRKETFAQLFDVLQGIIDRCVEQMDDERQHKIQFQKTLLALIERCRRQNEGRE